MKRLIEPGIVENFAICNDGSDPEHKEAYSRAWQRSAKLQAILGGWGREHNHGVGAAKNRCLEFLLDRGCNWLFLMEDDVEVPSANAISGFIEACLQSGWQHLCFHGHGPLNPAPRWSDELITSWPNAIGVFYIYSRQALERSGLFDEHFHNACEHFARTERLASEGFTAPWPDNLDATGYASNLALLKRVRYATLPNGPRAWRRVATTSVKRVPTLITESGVSDNYEIETGNALLQGRGAPNLDNASREHGGLNHGPIRQPVCCWAATER